MAKLSGNTYNSTISGHFANNQIKDGIVTWIQGGLWNIQMKSLPSNNTSYNTGGNNTEKPEDYSTDF